MDTITTLAIIVTVISAILCPIIESSKKCTHSDGFSVSLCLEELD